jgi:CelD/BcsL family acetyltransferase involved in cellulose biosynthesis
VPDRGFEQTGTGIDANVHQLSVAIGEADDLDAIGRQWLDLQARAGGSFFQSWAWIGTWLRQLPPGTPVRCIRVDDGERTVGLALVGLRDATRHRVFYSRQWCIAETGNPVQDALTIEHNGLLVDERAHDEVLRAVCSHLGGLRSAWDELVASGIDAERVPSYQRAAAQSDLWTKVRWSKPYYYVAAADLAATGGDYLAALSGNSRYQIRRSMREYEKSGPLSITAAESVPQAFDFFERLIELHQAYWNARGKAGAFATEFARRFHESLIRTQLEPGHVQLLRIAAGDEPIGYLYNFAHRGAIASYQSGFRYSDDAKLKPGLVSHALAIQSALASGAHSYDLLMGRQQYKEMLSTRRGEMTWLVIQQPRLRFRIERGLGALVARLRSLRARVDRARAPASSQPAQTSN